MYQPSLTSEADASFVSLDSLKTWLAWHALKTPQTFLSRHTWES